MLYDITITAEQVAALAAWVGMDGPDAAAVELLVDDRMLLAEQGDDRMAWDTGGEPASDEYLQAAPLADPLDRHREVFIVRPDDPSEDVAAFWREQDADKWRGTFERVGDVERVTVCGPALAERLHAERQDEDDDDDDVAPGTAQGPAPAGDALRAALQTAIDAMAADGEHWDRLQCGQDTEDAEESGRLAGYVEGLEAALATLAAGPTLDDVHALLSGREWSPDTVQAIADMLAAAGYTIDPPAPRDVGA